MCGDYDGDGRADFAWYLPESFRLLIRFADETTLETVIAEIDHAAALPIATPAAHEYRRLFDLDRVLK